jgi:Dyp-type peroxidase family
MTTIDFKDVQGLVFSGYNKNMHYASYYLLTIQDATHAREWLKNLIHQERITHGEERRTDGCLNLAFSYSGLSQLQKHLGGFELAFQEGMYSPRRSTLLGDQGENDPSKWQWGNDGNSIHILLMLYSPDATAHQQRKTAEEAAIIAGGMTFKCLDSVHPAEASGSSKEHFGFVDGVSDPLVEGFPKVTQSTNPQAPKVIATGEFILGHPNGYDGKLTQQPSAGSLGEQFGKNGTYLVFRQLEQDVAGFWTFINREANNQDIDADYLAAKIVGRWPSGAVVQANDRGDPKIVNNEFDYRDDPDGFGCPFGSHIRRANPRGIGLGETLETSIMVVNRHRLLRRGRSYGNFVEKPTQDDGGKRGLFFICLNANIERQFEFVQHTWINNPKFNGLYDEDDPLIGSYAAHNKNFTIPEQPVRQRICNFQPFVTVRGGGYFFLPGLNALKMLSEEQ